VAGGEHLTPSLIAELFAALDSKLAPRPIPIDLLVVGGAAISFRWNTNRLTRDVDVVDPLPEDVVAAVAAVAAETEGVSAHWLNDGAMVARPPGDGPGTPAVVYSGSALTVATPVAG